MRQFNAIDAQSDPDNNIYAGDGIDVSVSAAEDQEFQYDCDNDISCREEQVQKGRKRSRSRSGSDSLSMESVGYSDTGRNPGEVESDEDPVQTSSSKQRSETAHLRQENANLKKLLDEMVNQRVELKVAERLRDLSANTSGNQGRNVTQCDTRGKITTDSEVIKTPGVRPNLVKSPSDMTVYVPALKQSNVRGLDPVTQISNFVESVRLSTPPVSDNQNDDGQPAGKRQPRRSLEEELNQIDTDEERQAARDHAEKIILEAEKFKANVVAPPKGKVEINLGKVPKLSEELRLKHLLDSDDDFFHVTCHVHSAIKAKIQHGEFVELKKLLPRDRGNPTLVSSGEEFDFKNFLQAISRGGNTYVGPGGQDPRDRKISSVRKWEQAFRVYAAIYTETHPSRVAEIWQYVYTINTAALSFAWENVYFYDQTFRRLMEEKPWRSWVKTYNQGCNLAMRDLLQQQHNKGFNPVAGRKKDWKEECCWKFNKNHCKKSSSECNFEHRCTFCSIFNHGYHNCRKRLHKHKGGSGVSPPKKSE